MEARCAAVLKKKRDSFLEPAYRDTKVYKTAQEFAAAITPEQKPHLIVVGCPPDFRGSDEAGRDLELQLTKLFPDVGIFIEKPVTTSTVESSFRAAAILKTRSAPCAVG